MFVSLFWGSEGGGCEGMGGMVVRRQEGDREE
jgi:hypothetical protein